MNVCGLSFVHAAHNLDDFTHDMGYGDFMVFSFAGLRVVYFIELPSVQADGPGH